MKRPISTMAFGSTTANGSGYDHKIGLSRRRTRRGAETIYVGARAARMHQLYRAAGKAEQHVPDARLAHPVEQLVGLGSQNIIRERIQQGHKRNLKLPVLS